MNTNDDLERAKARLSEAPVKRRRPNCAAERVRLLLPEIRAARARGKGWEQIAADISADLPLRKDAVRLAFHRCAGKAQKPPRSPKPAPARATPARKASLSGLTKDMFAPLFDPFDAAGRPHSDKGENA